MGDSSSTGESARQGARRGRWIALALLVGTALVVLVGVPVPLRYDDGWFVEAAVEATGETIVVFARSARQPPRAVVLAPARGGIAEVRVKGRRIPVLARGDRPRGLADRGWLLGGLDGLPRQAVRPGRLLYAGGTRQRTFRVLEAILETGGTRALADALREAMESMGAWGPVVYVAAYTVGTVLAFPGSVLTVAGALAFGLWKGLLLVLVGANAGALAAFLVGRYLARDFIARALPASLSAFDARIAAAGLRTVLVLRLLPVFPFLAVNYFCGVSGIRLRDFALGTALGLVPLNFLFVYAASSAARITASDPETWLPLLALAPVLATPWLARRIWRSRAGR